MSALAAIRGRVASDLHAPRERPAIVAVLALALACSIAIVRSGGDPLLLVPLLTTLVIVAVMAHPVLGVYLVFGGAILLEQYFILGLEPITVGTHFYQNLSAYTPVPLRLSVVDLLMLLTTAAWAARMATGRHPRPRMGPLGWPIAGYGAVFVLGTAIGAARGGGWDLDAVLAELRGPVQLCVMYFLAANLIRERTHLRAVVWMFVLLVGVKGLQAIINYQDAANVPYNLEAVTAHEDVVFFDVAITLGVAAVALRVRSRLATVLLALQPLILVAELLTERRVGFVALGVGLVVVVILSSRTEPRRALALAAVGALAATFYVAAFWDSNGPLAEPVRAVRSVIDPSYVSARDQMSDDWRVREDKNIAYTIAQLPLTGVGLGQQYLVRESPPPLPPAFTYWRYITHNALLWLWLKAGPLGAFALWFLVARVVMIGSAGAASLGDVELRHYAFMPVCLIACQIVFSAVELGLTYSRTMIVLGTGLGLMAALLELAPRTYARAEPLRSRIGTSPVRA